jgi:hypothetical protein
MDSKRIDERELSALSPKPLCSEERMEQKAPDLRKKIARYRRSLAVMNDPDTIKMIEHMIKQTEEQIEAGERH